MKSKILIKKYIQHVGIIFTFFSMYYIFRIILIEEYNFIESFSNIQAFFALVIGVLFYLVTQLNAVLAWYLQLHKTYRNTSFIEFYIIIGLSQIGKYLPGNIGHIVGRSILASRKSFKLKDVGFSLFFETILIIYSSLIMGIGLLDTISLKLIKFNKVNLLLLFVVLTVFFIIYIKKYCYTLKFYISFKTIAKIILLNCFSFIILGLILFILQYLLLENNSASFIQLTSIISIAFVAGFIMPGSPAGIGIREYVFIELLSSNMHRTEALVIIIGLRIINLIGDLIMFFISFYLNNWKK